MHWKYIAYIWYRSNTKYHLYWTTIYNKSNLIYGYCVVRHKKATCKFILHIYCITKCCFFLTRKINLPDGKTLNPAIYLYMLLNIISIFKRKVSFSPRTIVPYNCFIRESLSVIVLIFKILCNIKYYLFISANYDCMCMIQIKTFLCFF